MVKGVVSQVIGPVVDVVFEVPEEQMPTLHDALDLTRQDGSHLILEVQQHIGDKTVRTIAMDSTDGLLVLVSPCQGAMRCVGVC